MVIWLKSQVTSYILHSDIQYNKVCHITVQFQRFIYMCGPHSTFRESLDAQLRANGYGAIINERIIILKLQVPIDHTIIYPHMFREQYVLSTVAYNGL